MDIITNTNDGFFRCAKRGPLDIDYRLGNIIGRGRYGIVRECICTKTGSKHAVKTFGREDFELKSCPATILNELLILKSLDHPNIVKLEDIYASDDDLFVVMKLADGGGLFDLVVDLGGFATQEELCCKVFKQIAEAIQYLHQNGIVHRDIKLENIRISHDYKPTVTDFGLAKKLSLTNQAIMRTRCGSPYAVAPEILRSENYTKSVDIWSLGVVLYTMLFCEYPFQSDSLDALYSQITEARYCFPPDVSVSDYAKDLIKHMLTASATERFSIEQVLAHPWLNRL